MQNKPEVKIDDLGRVIVNMPNGDEYAIQPIHTPVNPNTLLIRLVECGDAEARNLAVFPNVSNEVVIKTVNKHI